MPVSNFHNDLSKEEILGGYLDNFYSEIFSTSKFSIKRIHDINLQHKGVDLVLFSDSKEIYIDEKAQLDYLNKSLPTFAFELSYLKNKNWREGWLFDSSKITNIYFLITGIHTKKGGKLTEGISKIKITGIYRDKLIKLLADKGLNKTYLFELEKEIRKNGKHGKIAFPELDSKYEGVIYFSKDNKNEQPINLVLKLKFLTDNKIGKIIFNPTSGFNY